MNSCRSAGSMKQGGLMNEKNANGSDGAAGSSWGEFIEETTMHGIRHVKRTQSSPIRRIIWTLMIFICLLYFLVAAILFLRDYSMRPVNTKVKIVNVDQLQFPTVTICNKNFWKKSKALPESMTEEEKKLINSLMVDLYASGYNTSADKYNWSHPMLKNFAESSTLDISPEIMDKYLQSLAHTLEETISACKLSGVHFNCTDVFTQVKTDAGFCFQFNGDRSFEAHTSGQTGGLNFILNTLSDEYYIGPFSYSEGFYIALHDAAQIPVLSEVSYGVYAGLETNFIVQRKEIIREPPYADGGNADCFDTENLPNPLHFYKNYSYSACKRECLVSYVINKCGCRDVLYPALNETHGCIYETMLRCSNPAIGEFTSNPQNFKDCNCKPACHEIQYSAKLSSFKFPSVRFSSSFGYNESAVEAASKDYLAVSIIYGEMSYELVEETMAYSGYDFIASLGGTLGVCIGGSLLTIMEFIEFAAVKLTQAIQRNSTKRQAHRPPVTKVQPFDAYN